MSVLYNNYTINHPFIKKLLNNDINLKYRSELDMLFDIIDIVYSFNNSSDNLSDNISGVFCCDIRCNDFTKIVNSILFIFRFNLNFKYIFAKYVSNCIIKNFTDYLLFIETMEDFLLYNDDPVYFSEYEKEYSEILYAIMGMNCVNHIDIDNINNLNKLKYGYNQVANYIRIKNKDLFNKIINKPFYIVDFEEREIKIDKDGYVKLID